MKKYISEFIGTFALVFIGSGAYVFGLNVVGALGIGLVFGMAVAAVYGAFYKVSGAHINPAVSLGALVSGRLSGIDTIYYIISQLLGGLFGALAVYLIALGDINFQLISGLGQNGYGDASYGGYLWWAAVLFELVATFLYVYIFLGSTEDKKNARTAGLSIGLFFAAAYLIGIIIDGASLNPARSFGPGLVVGLGKLPDAQVLTQLPMFLIVPSIGGLLAGLAFKFMNKKGIDDDDMGTEFAESEVIEVIQE